jgi:hypothetical protein
MLHDCCECLCKCYNKSSRDIKFSQCLSKCYNKSSRDIKLSQCLSKCYMMIVVNTQQEMFSSQCLCKCYIMIVHRAARDIKFSQCICRCYMIAVNVYVNVTTNRLEISSSHNVYLNVIFFFFLLHDCCECSCKYYN